MNPRVFFIGRVIGFVVVLALALIAYYFFAYNTVIEEPIACTMEALLCPDGSGVGRSGPQCAFSPCPRVPFLIGTLNNNAHGFRLVMNSPNDENMGVAYTLPLEGVATDTISRFVSQNIKVFGIFREGNTFVVSRVEELPIEERDPTIGRVGVGKTVFINGVRITLHRVVQDSRCPVDAQCIEGGGITANVTFRSDTDSETRNMASDEAPLPFDSYRISIIRIDPPRMSGYEPDPSSYVLTFKVTANPRS